MSVKLAGDPIWDRLPRALQGQQERDKGNGRADNPPPLPVPSHENPKLAEAALKMFEKTAESEREERRRVEEKWEQRQASMSSGGEAVADAERRRADDLIRAEKERAETERRYLQERMEEMRREQQRYDSEARNRPSVAQEIGALLPLLQRDDSSRVMLEQILQKHRDEIAAVHDGHREFVKSLREGHQSEINSLRQAHQRELEAEREASRAREERIEERLRAEREERERDRQRYRESTEERDRTWRDRMEGALQTQEQSWQSRHSMLQSMKETAEQGLRAEIDKLKQENYELRTKQEEKGDIFSQLSKHRELASIMKEFGSGDTSSSTSGGIGLSGAPADDWKQTLAEGLSERAPAILQKLFGADGAVRQVSQPTQQQMQQFVEGQVVQTPQGVMEVVRNPADGSLALAPKEAMDRRRAHLAAEASREADERRSLLDGQGAERRRPSAMRRRNSQRKTESADRAEPQINPIPNLAEGLPRRRPPWEGGGMDPSSDGSAGAAPPRPPLVTPKPSSDSAPQARPAEEPESEPPLELTSVERQVLRVIAQTVHESVQHADEPEEWVSKVIEQYPAPVLQQIVGNYTDAQVMRGVRQLEPNSAGATPAGQKFMAAAFRGLRKAMS
jgi:hypothetical protein